MFTGLIEHRAQLYSRTPQDSTDSNAYAAGGFTLTFHHAGPILGDCTVGDSIAVNGACLTVLEFDPQGGEHGQHAQTSGSTGPIGGWFKMGLAPETLNRTNLGQLKEGDWVNCERAMSADTRFGGHFVQGYITLDGTSLTLTESSVVPATAAPSDGAQVNEQVSFGIMLIAHSQSKVTLSSKNVGDTVNVEVDSVGKFIGVAVDSVLSGSGGAAGKKLEGLIESIVERVLEKRGLI
ncbi:Riboflavin synthase alpha chain [Phaffia rhodozyma]|uniref:Riboflavin synthase alpha chain n=1 Tax=Phaffia rhodozyma TaxID=264483 RepID=A0A0F7SWF5_PHARH|nr:Riboflavin synthase alpha chain [Phaffia rhodozyma]